MPEVIAKINRSYSFLNEYVARWEVIMGGAGAGKSYAVFQSVVLGALSCPKRKYACLRKVGKSLRWSIYSLVKNIISELGLGLYFRENKSEMSFTCVNGAQIILLGLDDVEKMKSIFGVTDIILEEATEFVPMDLTQLNLRLRGGDLPLRLVLMFNPILNTHHLKRRFFDSPQDNVRLHVMTYKDNAFLDEEYKRQLEALKVSDPNSYNVYTLAKWGELGEGVFTNFIVHDFDFDDDSLDGVSSGLDFGFNHASALERKGWHDGELYFFDEFYAKGLTNPELIGGIKGMLRFWQTEKIKADSAEPARIEEFLQEGFTGIEAATKGDASVLAGINYLKAQKIHVHKTRCPHLAEELPAYQWRVDRNGDKIDKPVCMNDDAIAACRYSTEDDRSGFVGVSEELKEQMRERRQERMAS